MTATTTVTTTDDRAAAPPPPAAPSLWRRIPARVRIMVWVVLLMVGVLTLVNVITWQALRSGVDDRIDSALTQEHDEFSRFFKSEAPETRQHFSSVDAALRTYVVGQYPDDNEIIFGHVDDAPGAQVPTGRVRQYPEPLYDVSADEELREEILGSPAARGEVDTPAGVLRWHKARLNLANASADNPGGWFVIGYFVEAERADVNRTIGTLGLVSAVGLVIAGAAAWWVSGRILAPIRLVRQTAAQISEEDLTRRIDVPGNDDVAALAEQFNAMLDRLEESFSAQRRFVDDAGHELRTPITIVRGHLELMGDDPEERREVVRLVTDELDRMARIVDDLLLLAKAERPDFVQPRTVWLAELTGDIDAKVRALADRTWRLEHVGEGAVHVDPQRITQAMVQLASNAAQHTGPGDTISIGSAMTEDGGAVLWVGDTGPGVPEADRERIFERFSRGSGTRNRSGAGLGLAIVRAIVEAHHGRVELRSVPGRGAEFSLVLPPTHPDRAKERM
ncbi:sensor histidine kinase [Streptomonospora nanhaiensis]|uniref:sensor histidine kinase n=1 Tax=Streptomonospora nanhaiensis TaxID=1323731 RepID=UPI0020CB39B4|nr:ATP-binding protein [Streptomonospora nanhaiensis]